MMRGEAQAVGAEAPDAHPPAASLESAPEGLA
jgi:hypothetical protein